MNVPDRLRLPRCYDPERLGADLAALEAAEWIAHFVASNYDGDWSVIPLRAPAGAKHPIQQIFSNPAATDWAETLYLAACPYIREILSGFGCPLQAARLMRLGAGSRILEHRDPDLDFEAGFARLHVPIATSPDVDFRLNGARVDMAPGELWYLRLSDPHCVFNRSTKPRVHLVIDAIVDPWLAAMFARALETAA